MILKLETFVEIDTKEPTVVKQLLNEKLAQSLKQCQQTLDFYCYRKPKQEKNEGIDSCWDEASYEIKNFVTLLWNNDVTVLTPDQVVERLRKGIKDKH
jgi:hypothetical protein